MAELELNWSRATTIWWAIIWRAALVGVLLGIAIGVVTGIIGTLLGYPQDKLSAVVNLVGIVIGIPVGIWAVKAALVRSFSGFRIALLPPQQGGNVIGEG